MSYPMQANCTQISPQMLVCGTDKYTLGDHLDHTESTRFFIDIGIVAGLVLLAGLMSGLTMGLMSMDQLNLKILVNGPDEKQKKYASKILPLVERHHLLLVTLLISNAACAEALPIFLDRLVHPAVAVIVSVTLVLLFGEIIPQAICTRYGLQIGASLSWFVWVMIALMLPIAWPIAKLLDALLGKETGTFFRRAELKELVHLHSDEDQAPEGESLTIDEVRIIKGAIDMKEKTVGQAFTQIDKVYAIDVDGLLSREVLQQIVESGHDRIPVYHNSRDHFIGMILVKDLILIDPNANTPVRNLKVYRVPMVGSDMPLYDMLHQFQTGRSHMSIVLDPNDHITPQGIITLEDVMEELLQEEILDEDDYRKQSGEQNYGSVVHDVRLAKAFLPRKSLAPLGGSPRTRKLSMVQGGSHSSQGPYNFQRRTTYAPSSSYSASSINSNNNSSAGNHALIHVGPPPPPAYPTIPNPPGYQRTLTNSNNANANTSEFTPLIPGGKGNK